MTLFALPSPSFSSSPSMHFTPLLFPSVYPPSALLSYLLLSPLLHIFILPSSSPLSVTALSPLFYVSHYQHLVYNSILLHHSHLHLTHFLPLYPFSLLYPLFPASLLLNTNASHPELSSYFLLLYPTPSLPPHALSPRQEVG